MSNKKGAIGTYKGQNSVTAVTNFMRYIQPISSLFVLEAIGRYADQVLENKEQLKEEMKMHIIQPELWIQIAEDWKEMEKIRSGKDG